MPIAENFPQGLKPIGKIMNADGQHFHIMWGPGRNDAECFHDEAVISAYKTRGETQVPLGVSGTMVAVDWDSCVAAGSCMSVCPVQTFQWYRTEQDIPAKDVLNATFAGTGKTEQDERLDYTDKSMPIREHDCTNCLACQEICPSHAITINQPYQEFHEKAAGTFVKLVGSSENPHAHH